MRALAATLLALSLGACSIDFDRFVDRDAMPADAGTMDSGEPPSDATPDGAPADAGGLSAPVLRFPWNGYDTGTAHEPAMTAITRPKRPTFRWDSVPGALRYEIVISETCEGGTVPDCTPGAAEAEIDESVGDTSLTPDADLPAAARGMEIAPSGTRYYWAVRACDDAECSAWSDTWYVDVGRLPDDYDGDGYSDLLVGAPTNGDRAPGPGVIYSFGGGATFGPARRITGSSTYRLGEWVAAAGDVNGDGFADAIVCEGRDATRAPVAHVIYGAPAGLPSTLGAGVTLTTTDVELRIRAAGAGDVDGDGYDDVLVGAVDRSVSGSAGAGAVHVYYGGPAGIEGAPDATIENPSPQPSAGFGFGIAALGDVDRDGFSDVGISAISHNDGTSNSGRVYVLYGSRSGLDASARATIDNPDGQEASFFGAAIAGRGNGDVFVSAILHDDEGTVDAGMIYRFRIDDARRFTFVERIRCPSAVAGARCGASLGLGDVHADGGFELVAGAQNQDSPTAVRAGLAYVTPVAPSIALGAGAVLTVTHTQADTRFAETLATADYDGDGLTDIALSGRRFSDPSGIADESGAVPVFFGRDLAPGMVLPLLVRAPTPAQFEWFGTAVAGF